MKHILDKEKKRSKFAHGEVVIEPGTGRILSMAVNRTYSLDQSHNGKHSDRPRHGLKGNYPNTVNPLLGGGTMAGYQAGSTFKIFTMLAALDAGMPLSTRRSTPRSSTCRSTSPRPARPPAARHWCPKNSSQSMTGTADHVERLRQVGEHVLRAARAEGRRRQGGGDGRAARAAAGAPTWTGSWPTPEHAAGWGAFTLGVSDATPMEMANVFATLAAEGNYCEPLPVTLDPEPGRHATPPTTAS